MCENMHPFDSENVDIMENNNGISDAEQEGSPDASPSGTGRLPDAVKDIRDEGYKEIERMFSTLSNRSSINVDTLVSGYYRRFTHRKVAFHSWNTYQVYFAANRDTEVQRTYPPEKKVDLDRTYIYLRLTTYIHHLAGSSEVTIRRKCFESFKNKFPKRWQDILLKYSELQKFSAAGKTIAQRSRTFKKVCDQLETMAESSATLYGFQFAIVMAGSVVNEDASLGRMYETENAKDVSGHNALHSSH